MSTGISCYQKANKVTQFQPMSSECSIIYGCVLFEAVMPLKCMSVSFQRVWTNSNFLMLMLLNNFVTLTVEVGCLRHPGATTIGSQTKTAKRSTHNAPTSRHTDK